VAAFRLGRRCGVPDVVGPRLRFEVPAATADPRQVVAAIADEIRRFYWDHPDRPEWVIVVDHEAEFLSQFDWRGLPLTRARVIAGLASAGRAWVDLLNSGDGLEFVLMQAGGKLYARWVGERRVEGKDRLRLLGVELSPDPVRDSPGFEVFT